MNIHDERLGPHMGFKVWKENGMWHARLRDHSTAVANSTLCGALQWIESTAGSKR